MSIFLKRPSRELLRKVPKYVSPRFCASQKNNKENPQNFERKLRNLKRLSAIGITAAILGSYLLVKSNYFNNNMKLGNDKQSEPKRERLLQRLDQKNQNFDISDELGRENSMREKYNFIKKVVNDCASAVFYLELRDPYKRDLETGQPIITSNGSGFIISEDGWALTNAHVVLNKPQSTISAIMRDGKTYRVRVEDADMNIDLALLKIDTNEKLPCLQFGESGDTSVGEWVIALGSPLSLSNSVTVGIVSCVDRPAEELGLKNYSMTYIQTDASITFGNSGGPLVNLDGNVIGINNLRLTSGISFAIPVEYVKKFLDNGKFRVKKNSEVGLKGKVMLGITTISITPDLVSDLLKENQNIPPNVAQGLLVWKIIPGSPAYICGMEVGDIITHVNGIQVNKSSELYEITSAVEDPIEITLIHRGKEVKAKLTAKKS